MLKEILDYRDLLFMLTQRNIRIRYKQAIMGFLWAIFMPIVAILSGILIKKAISIFSGNPLELTGIVSLMVKVLPWTFFVSAVRFSSQSLISSRNLVTKIYFPREVLPLSFILASLFDFLIACTTLTVFLFIIRIGFSFYLLLIPCLLIFLVLFTTGLCLILSSANLFFRDVKYVVDIILMFGIFFTPVFYEASLFGKWETLLLLNPVGSILEAINTSVVLQRMPDIPWFIYAGLSSTAMCMIGLIVFHKQEPYFAENI